MKKTVMFFRKSPPLVALCIGSVFPLATADGVRADPSTIPTATGTWTDVKRDPPLLSADTEGDYSDAAPAPDTLALGDWLTVAANVDAGYRQTQFFEDNHDVFLVQWDSRLELWLPPYRRDLSWGPYLRFAGIEADQDPAFENGLLAVPGFGLQAYPFSFPVFRREDSVVGRVLGPLRAFAEYNVQHYWGEENKWRPDEQVRIGFDYYRAINVNSGAQPLWCELFGLLAWQSANEFDNDYQSIVFAGAVRAGARVPHAGPLSMITPYVVAESSLTENGAYAFENRLLLGAGLRLDPDLRSLPKELDWLSRFVFFVEYVDAVSYYRDDPPPGTPGHDWRVGISVSVGDFFK